MTSSLLPAAVLGVVFIIIAVRQVGRYRVRIWQIMLAGAATVLLLGQITPGEALFSINSDVMLFLFGMFVVGEALDRSGYLEAVSHRFFSRAGNGRQFILLVLVGMGLVSALLMNDTVAIIGTPLVLAYSRRFQVPPRAGLLTLCFAVTIGSVMSPIGNPQNLLIASYSGIPEPFLVFLVFLGLPTMANLLIAYIILCRFYPLGDAPGTVGTGIQARAEKDDQLAGLCRLSLGIILLLIGVRVVAVGELPLTAIALAGAAPVLIGSRQRFTILRRIDWPTLVFFASMFVLMQSVYQSGVFQSVLDLSLVTSVPVILGVSVVLSQFISNVPFVALFQPLIVRSGLSTPSLMALAAGSTIAGNLTILGAASNVIIIQNAEKQGETLTFWEFLRVGLPLTIANVLVYALYLSLF